MENFDSVSRLLLNLDDKQFKWMDTVYTRLPNVVVCEGKRLEQQQTTRDLRRFLYSSSGKKYEIDVDEYRNLRCLQLDRRGTEVPLRAVLDLEHPQFRELLAKSGFESHESGSVLHVSLHSGIIMSLPEEVICVVTSQHEGDPQPVLALDSSNVGAVYLSFYITMEATGKVVFDFNFYEALTNEFVSFKQQGKCIVNLKSAQDDSFTVPGLQAEIQSEASLMLGSECNLELSNLRKDVQRLAVLLLPRQRFSLGTALSCSPGICFIEKEDSFKVADWLQPQSVSEESTERSTLCMCVLGDCLNKCITLSRPRYWFRSLTTSKPGLNGFIGFFLEFNSYKHLMNHFRQRHTLKQYYEHLSVLAGKLVSEYQRLGFPTFNEGLLYRRFRKSLSYAYAFNEQTGYKCTFQLGLKDFSQESIQRIGTRLSLVDVEEFLEVGALPKYDAAEEQFVLDNIPKAKAQRIGDSKSFVKTEIDLKTADLSSKVVLKEKGAV